MSFRVLVTGAGGLIGPHACRALTAGGYEVVTVGRSERCDFVADLLDDRSRWEAVRAAKASHLLHLAWHDDPINRWFAAENLDWAKATIGLLRDFSCAGGERALCAGSCAEYSWSHDILGSTGLLSECSPIDPGSLYGRSKALTGELLVKAQVELGVSLSWGRIFFCYGPGEANGRLMSDVTRGICNGECVPCTDGMQKRDFLYTPDLGVALAAVLSSKLTGAVNIGSGVASPVRDLIMGVANLLGRPDLIELGVRPRPESDPPVICADISRLASIGWSPRYALEDGLRDCLFRQGLLAEGVNLPQKGV